MNQCRLVDSHHPQLSIRRQCQLLGLNRATYYYKPQPESDFNLALMRRIDELYLLFPFYGSRSMRSHLRAEGWCVNRKRVKRLMRKMGIMAIYPKPKTTIPSLEHRVYPYLLRGLPIDHPNQVWCTDITYIRMRRGFVYLVVVMDWFSRYVLTWELSNTMDKHFCVTALERALAHGRPEIFNSDQGSQFTSHAFTNRLETNDIRISMDGRGRAFDNIFIERFWRTLKYQHIYLHEYDTIPDLWHGLNWFIPVYNEIRPHQGLNGHTPATIYHQLATPTAAPSPPVMITPISPPLPPFLADALSENRTNVSS